MLAAPLVALDLPLRVLIWEDASGQVFASYLSPTALAERYGLAADLIDSIRAIKALVDLASL